MSEAEEPSKPTGVSRSDLLALTKFRLSLLVVVTALAGFWLNSGHHVNWWLMFHTLLGSTLAAFGAGAFNQLMEIEPDRLMQRTADRPLPARRMDPGVAFGIGWLLSSFALIHLAKMVNLESAIVTAMTLGVYLFVYTPMKQRTSWNTIVGAVSGALPPLIGWTGAVGQPEAANTYFRFNLILEPGAIYLFLLLFLWQMPHFLAINWMYRDQYLKGGFVMWANEDDTGKQTASLSLGFALAAVLLVALPPLAHDTHWPFIPLALLVNAGLLLFAWRFYQTPDRAHARKLFFYTLIYLPLMLAVSMIFWRYH